MRAVAQALSKNGTTSRSARFLNRMCLPLFLGITLELSGGEAVRLDELLGHTLNVLAGPVANSGRDICVAREDLYETVNFLDRFRVLCPRQDI